jgi:hypothetical protein
MVKASGNNLTMVSHEARCLSPLVDDKTMGDEAGRSEANAARMLKKR